MTTPLPMMDDYELGRCEITAHENGFGGIETERGMLPLRTMKVDTEIVGLTARTTLRQTFENVWDVRLEATYIFPLPARAAVRRFRMFVDGRVVEGEIQERAEARETYDRAIESGQRASIVEQERPDVFTIRVGNIAPGETVEIEFEMVGPLTFADGEATWRFPLVVAPRYVPGEAIGDDVGTGTSPDTDRVPDASRITPPTMLEGYPSPIDLQLRVAVDGAGLPLTDLRGSLPAEITGEGSKRVVEVKPGERLDRDFIIRFRTTADEVASALVYSPGDAGEEGTFELTVMPPKPAIDARKPRDVVFVLDRSGSMGGWKMVAARRAMGRMVDTLTADDRFTVVAFDTQMESPEEHAGVLVEGSDRNRWRAVEFLSGIDARGGTDLDRAIRIAVERMPGGYSDRERQIIVVTDGQVSQEAAVLDVVRNRGEGIRFFTVGIDRAVNASLLQRIAEYGGGACELVESEDRLDRVMDAVHRRIDAVVVDELGWDFDGLEVDRETIVPQRPPALFAGAPLVVRGRARRGSGPIEARLSGVRSGESWKARIAGEERSEPAVASMWARHRLVELEDRWDATHDSDLVDEITRISLEHAVLCRFTAFVAVDQEGTVDTSTDLHRVTQLVEEPAGWAATQTFAPAPRSPMLSGAPQSPPPQASRGVLQSPMMERTRGGSPDTAGGASDKGGGGFRNYEPAPLDLRETIQKMQESGSATEEEVLIAIFVYLVSGAWTLEVDGLDVSRSAAVLGRQRVERMLVDLRAELERLEDVSAMIPEGPVTDASAAYTEGEAASIVARLSVAEPERIAEAVVEDLEIRGGVVQVAKRSSRAFWK